jgi:4-diphosphocytidyl-2-C-methyl-D-erythritol kinase
MIVPAYAKLNLTLDLLGRRDDGYHEIASVMQTISLHDLLLVERAECRSFEVFGPPLEGENLVLKAARALEAWTGRALGFRIRLHKRIPIGGGLGGGSSDAASFLKAADRLYGLKLAREEMLEIAGGLGQDVPFFLGGGTAVASGRGATVEALPPLPRSWSFLVACPQLGLSTAEVYQAADGSRMATADRTPRVAAALRAGRPVDPAELGNDLEPAALEVHPPLKPVIAQMREHVPQLRMTGTGSAFYALFPEAVAAQAAFERMVRAGLAVRLCRVIGPTP